LIHHVKIILKYVNPEIDIAENTVEMHSNFREHQQIVRYSLMIHYAQPNMPLLDGAPINGHTRQNSVEALNTLYHFFQTALRTTTKVTPAM